MQEKLPWQNNNLECQIFAPKLWTFVTHVIKKAKSENYGSC